MVGIIVLVVVGIVALAWFVRQVEPRLAFYPFAGENRTPADFGLAFTALTIATTDGEQLRVWHLPRADAVAQVLYFHGNGGNLSLWSDILAGVVQHGYEVIAFDYRGFGVSTGAPTEQGLYRDVEAALALVDGPIRRKDLPLIYWGRSIGTTMAAYGASRRPPDGIVLEAGFPDARAILRDNPVMLALSLFATYRFPTAEWMARVTAPALVIHGDADSVIRYELGQQLYGSLTGPKQFVTVAGGDHNDALPADPAMYWGAVKDFVAAISASRPR
jgi:pimeloyl-ACP methyl ester carboxylesterase